MRILAAATVLALAALAAGCATPPTGGARAGPLSDEVSAPRQILVTVRLDRDTGLRRAGSGRRVYSGGGYGPSPRLQRTVRDLAKDHDLAIADEWPIRSLAVHCVVYEAVDERSATDAAIALAADPRVESVQAMQLFDTLGASRAYDDPYYELQHAARSLDLAAAHRSATGRGVVVAVVDTAVDESHPDLRGRIIDQRNFTGTKVSGSGHGTGVAGVIASVAGNGEGIVGVAPDARIRALGACWTPPGDEAGRAVCSSFTLARALDFAAREPPAVLNLSLGGPSDPLLERLLARVIDGGTLVVGATHPRLSPSFPTAVPGVIAAGPPPRGHAAPAEGVITTAPDGSYDFVSGSSIAAAHVTGVIALMLETDGGLSPADAEQMLVEAVGGTSPASLSACRALAAVRPGTPCGETPAEDFVALPERP